MNVLVFNWQDITHPLGGGAEVHLHEIFERFAAVGHKVTLVCCHHAGAKRNEVINGINVIRIGNRQTFNYWVPFWWFRHGKRLNPDIVVDDINKIPFFTPLFIKKPILALIHHFFGDSIFKEVGWAAGTYVNAFENRIPTVYRSTPITVVSESTKQECIERGFPSSNLRIVHNAIDHALFPMKITEKQPEPTVVSFGRLKKYKSIDHLIKAIALVKRDIPDVRLKIAGGGDERSNLEQIARELGVESNIEFLGYIENDRKSPLLSSAHVVVNTSIKEGWGITNLEANACGTPVVSANVPGLRDSVKNGYSGLLYDYGNIEDLAKLITKVLSDADIRDSLSNGALNWASTFTWDRSSSEMMAICNDVIAQWNSQQNSST